MKARSKTDRRVAKIIAAFDGVLASQYRLRCKADGCGDVMVDYFMHAVTLSKIEAFIDGEAWPDHSLRALLVTWLTYCPEMFLVGAVEKAERELADCHLYWQQFIADGGIAAESVGAA